MNELPRFPTILLLAALAAVYGGVGYAMFHPQVDDLYRLYYVEQRLAKWDGGSKLDYRPGDVLDFTAAVRYVSRRGWMPPEADGTSSDGPTAELFLRVVGPDAPTRLRIAGRPVLADDAGLPSQALIVSMNGVAVGRAEFDAERDVVLGFRIPAAALVGEDRITTIRFDFARPAAARTDAATQATFRPAFVFRSVTLE